SCKDVVGFLRKRALLEEDYGRQLAKMVKEFGGKESPKIYGREGSWTAGWTAFGAIHATVAQHHLELATALTELAEDVNTLSKDTERNRKQLRDDVRYQWKQVEDAVGVLEKSKQKYEASTHDWERTSQSSRIAQQAQGHGHSYGADSQLQKLQKNESGARSRATLANEAYRQQLFVTNGKRRDYYELHLPRLIRLLVDSIQKADDGLLRHLQGYVALYERCLMNEAMSTAPPSGQKTQPGMADVLGRVDLDGDLDAYVAVHLAEGRPIGSGAPGAFDATAVPMGNGNASRQYAGLDLITIADRDGEPVPVIVAALIQAIEAQGLAREGIYRVSGNSAHTARLLRRIDLHGTAPQPALRDEDRAVLTSALKQFFRELPDGLFPRASYRPLMQAMRNDDPQRRLMAVHEIINGLPDAHYGTIQVLFRHLAKVAAQEATNRMSADNLGLIWGPSLL
ncbi:RhoGAP-domain-containing protein, partial [Caulochytrium protostelioides]